MSKNSKARRDARKKKQPKARRRSVTTNSKSAEPHAALLGDGGVVLGGAAFHSGEWILLLNGEVVSGTNSAAMILAMLKHTANVRESEGMAVRLTYSTTLKTAATKEAAMCAAGSWCVSPSFIGPRPVDSHSNCTLHNVARSPRCSILGFVPEKRSHCEIALRDRSSLDASSACERPVSIRARRMRAA